VFFFDEGRFGLEPNLGRHWARRGRRPVSLVEPRCQNFYVYSAVPPHDEQAFSLFLPWANTEMMNLYLDELAQADPDARIIRDQAGWHGSLDLKLAPKCRCEALPPNSPELNPTERLRQWLRRHVTRNRTFDNEESLMDQLATALTNMAPAQLATLCRCSYLRVTIVKMISLLI